MATKKAKTSKPSRPAAKAKKAPAKKAAAKKPVKTAAKTVAKKATPAQEARQRETARKAVLALRDQVKAAQNSLSSESASMEAEARFQAAAATTPDPSRDLALLCARAVIDKKAQNTMLLEVGSKGSFADYFLISSGTNEKQVQAMADEAVVKMKKAGLMPKVEGYEGGRWILVDGGSVVLHLFHDDIRGYYRLEDLWRDALRVSIPAEYYTSAQA